MSGRAQLIAPPADAHFAEGLNGSIRMRSSAVPLGAAPPRRAGPPRAATPPPVVSRADDVPGNDKFEPGAESDDVQNAAWEQQVRARELQEGIVASQPSQVADLPLGSKSDAALYVPSRAGTVTRSADLGATTGPIISPVSPSFADLAPLPDSFAFTLERRTIDGAIWWRVSAPSLHVGVTVFDLDLPTALAKAVFELARFLKFEGVLTGKPRKARKAKSAAV